MSNTIEMFSDSHPFSKFFSISIQHDQKGFEYFSHRTKPGACRGLPADFRLFMVSSTSSNVNWLIFECDRNR